VLAAGAYVAPSFTSVTAQRAYAGITPPPEPTPVPPLAIQTVNTTPDYPNRRYDVSVELIGVPPEEYGNCRLWLLPDDLFYSPRAIGITESPVLFTQCPDTQAPRYTLFLQKLVGGEWVTVDERVGPNLLIIELSTISGYARRCPPADRTRCKYRRD
jgi:hypothetical protein